MTTTKNLELIQVAATTVLDAAVMKHGWGGRWSAHVHVPIHMHAAVVSMQGMLAADNIKTVEIRYPRDWWEAVKERWAPTWALSRWPVRYREHKIDLKAVYPEMPLPAKYGRSIRIVQHTDNSLEWGYGE